MDTKIEYIDEFVVGNLNINFSTELSEEKAFEIFSELRKILSSFDIKYFDHDKDEDFLRLNNGSSVAEADERIVKLVKKSNLQILWGKNTKLDIVKEICGKTAAAFIEIIPLIQISDFNYEQNFDVDSTGNAYEKIASNLYSEKTVGKFYQTLQEGRPNAKILDNDLHFLFSIDDGLIGSIRVRGRTTSKEIFTGEYDDDPIRFFFGIQNKRIPDSDELFITEIVNHLTLCDELCRDLFYDHIIAKFLSNNSLHRSGEKDVASR